MSKFSTLLILSALLLVATPEAEARKTDGGNPLPAPTLVSVTQLADGAGECDGDDLTLEDSCLEVVFVKVCEATKYAIPVTKGFDTDDNGCTDTSIEEDNGVAAEDCTGDLNCQDDSAECQTALVPVGTTTFCVNDGDEVTDCVGDQEDVEVSALSVCTKLKAINPPKKGPKAVSQSTPFSETICSDANDECI